MRSRLNEEVCEARMETNQEWLTCSYRGGGRNAEKLLAEKSKSLQTAACGPSAAFPLVL